MKKTLLCVFICVLFLNNTRCNTRIPVLTGETVQILKVPKDFPTIAEAIKHSKDGDWIILSPGQYHENNIKINKAVTISSEWKMAGDKSKIEETTINS